MSVLMTASVESLCDFCRCSINNAVRVKLRSHLGHFNFIFVIVTVILMEMNKMPFVDCFEVLWDMKPLQLMMMTNDHVVVCLLYSMTARLMSVVARLMSVAARLMSVAGRLMSVAGRIYLAGN